MSKIAVLVTDFVEDIEYTSPVEALEKAGNDITVIEFEAGKTVEGKHGTKIKVDKAISDVKPEDFDGLLIPGGFSPDQLRDDEKMVDFVKSFLLASKPTFAICHGPQLFIQTGLTKGRKMTAYNTVRPDLYYAGAEVEDKAVVVDNNLVTSRTPDDLDQFNAAIVDTLK
ncbi:glutamine amidotransferase [Lentilactobacillus curieae]|uniref:Glutamine amidotransferase n=1 Tax=Lentilactobacillus curieae TaxID=1138822 RepID=A0A1S6QHA0_9LACO|nr:type 1 glutamine amidotransferase domain-containing protein [Lentilactobacillus curieae]AQW20981.1 glutamine amidotransferase [Lentilactobacillus curieae]